MIMIFLLSRINIIINIINKNKGIHFALNIQCFEINMLFQILFNFIINNIY